MTTQIPDGDYILSDGRAWVEVGPYAVRIVKTNDGISVDVYQNHKEADSPLTSCWCMDSDLEEEA